MVDWDEIGEGDKACQNPPELTDHDTFVFEWYYSYPLHGDMGFFLQTFQLLPSLILEMKMSSDERALFLHKLNMIYKSYLRIQNKKIGNKDAES